MIGSSQYDDVCSAVRQQTAAYAVLLVVIKGNQGSGFSAQMTNTLRDKLDIPSFLRRMANDVEEEQEKVASAPPAS